MKRLLLLTLLMFSSTLSYADVLSIATPSYTTPNTASGVLRPTQGMDMTTVQREFGEPTEKGSAVGEPPITRWRYPTFDVFFEHQKVIHAVVKRSE